MATSESAQATLGQYGVHRYDLGDLLHDHGHGSSRKLILTECPICAVDPDRPRYHFGDQEKRPPHFVAEHGPDELTSARR